MKWALCITTYRAMPLSLHFQYDLTILPGLPIIVNTHKIIQNIFNGQCLSSLMQINC